MYQSIYYDKFKNIIHLWDDTNGYRNFPYNKYGYVKDSNGKFTALDGTKVEKITEWERDDENLYETDIRPEVRTLIDMYGASDDSSTNHVALYFDIEVAKGIDGFSPPMEAKNPITAITCYDNKSNKYTVFILDTGGIAKLAANTTTDQVYSFQSESELLIAFYKHWNTVRPTIVTGWNVAGYDIPYLFNRTTRVINNKLPQTLSPINIVKYSELHEAYVIAGVSILDYLDLYKTYTYNEESSYTLDSIAKKELKKGKIEYDGSLDDLFKTDISKFIEYNKVDVELVVELDQKLKFIDLARGVCHKGHVPYEDVFMPSRYIDGAALTYMKRKDIVAPNRKSIPKLHFFRNHRLGEVILEFKEAVSDMYPKSGFIRILKSKTSLITGIEYKGYEGNKMFLVERLPENIDKSCEVKLEFPGAYVKPPVPGKYDWVYDLDLQSQYPCNLMTLNISPETKAGKIIGYHTDSFNDETEYKIFISGQEYNTVGAKIKALMEKEKFSISSNGVLYRTETPGLIPEILDVWFDERTEFKNLMKKYGKSGDKVQYEYYHGRQWVQKILLNTFYGVLALPTFRFYDLDNAEAVTATGQELIKFTAKAGNHYYNKEVGDSIDYNIYVDTDSCFFSSLPLIKHRHPDVDVTDTKLMSQYTLEIATEVQNFINIAYDTYAKKCHNVDKHRWVIKQEYIAKSALWLAKKRYAQWIINADGVPVDKLDVKGIDVVRSNFPTAFRKFMSGMITDILKDKGKDDINKLVLDFRTFIKTANLYDIMFPTGVKILKTYMTGKHNGKFSECKKGTPIHVKAAIAYNDMLKLLKLDKDHEKIQNNEKLKWTYLRNNPYGLDVIALKGHSDPDEIINLIKKYIDYEKVFTSGLANKLADFYSAMKWGSIPKQEQKNAFFEF